MLAQEKSGWRTILRHHIVKDQSTRLNSNGESLDCYQSGLGYKKQSHKQTIEKLDKELDTRPLYPSPQGQAETLRAQGEKTQDMQLRLWRSPLAAWVLLVHSALAKVAFTNTDFSVEAGKPFTITWEGASGPVTLELISGPDSANLSRVLTIGSQYIPS